MKIEQPEQKDIMMFSKQEEATKQCIFKVNNYLDNRYSDLHST